MDEESQKKVMFERAAWEMREGGCAAVVAGFVLAWMN